jgi:Ran GTPase-activating protein (RanGAP) involved in mRNA processing and transport
MGQCTGLAHLNLCDNEIGAAGAQSLAGVLGQCPALAHLDLWNNGIGDAGSESLAGVLAQCTALAHLDLRQPQAYRCSRGKFLAEVLGQCAVLAHLELSCNEIVYAGAQMLAECWSGPEGGLNQDSEGSAE